MQWRLLGLCFTVAKHYSNCYNIFYLTNIHSYFIYINNTSNLFILIICVNSMINKYINNNKIVTC